MMGSVWGNGVLWLQGFGVVIASGKEGGEAEVQKDDQGESIY